MSSTRKYTDQEISILRQTSITEILRDLGKNPKHTAKNMYFSPFHDEKTPSFHVDEENHRWFDFGNHNPSKAGGDVLSLVMLLRNCSFHEACDYLSDFHPNVSLTHDDLIGDVPGGQTYSGGSKITIENVHECFTSRLLTQYASQKRCIPLNILEKYCRQVDYSIEYGNGKKNTRFAIGFQNCEGNWELRDGMDPPKDPNDPKSRYTVKRSTGGKNISVFNCEGVALTVDDLKSPNGGKSSSNVVVFEGFMDFMSWLAWNGIDKPTTRHGITTDVVVLNSCINVKHAIDFLAKHEKVSCYLDTDATGQRYTEFIHDEMAALSTEDRQIVFRDGSESYAGYNDVNEAWQATCAKRREARAAAQARDREVSMNQTLSSGPKIH